MKTAARLSVSVRETEIVGERVCDYLWGGDTMCACMGMYERERVHKKDCKLIL